MQEIKAFLKLVSPSSNVKRKKTKMAVKMGCRRGRRGEEESEDASEKK